MDYFSFFICFFTVFITLLGIVIGSFLNVVIYRTPMERTIVKGHSMCMTCSHELAAKDLIPVFSWLFLRGKCRYCGAPIPSRYFKIESLTGLVFLLATLLHTDSLYFFPFLSMTGNFDPILFSVFAYHMCFLISCCMIISAMMIWYDTEKCFWRLPITIFSMVLLQQIIIHICVGAGIIIFLKSIIVKLIGIVVIPAISFVIFKAGRKSYTKNELTIDLTFACFLLFSSYLMFANSWVITCIFAVCFSLLRLLSIDTKVHRYCGIIGAATVVIFLILSYII